MLGATEPRIDKAALFSSLTSLIVISWIIFLSRYEIQKGLIRRSIELARTQESLRREIEEKNEFLRAVSHDLQAPLRNISGLVESICRRNAEDRSAIHNGEQDNGNGRLPTSGFRLPSSGTAAGDGAEHTIRVAVDFAEDGGRRTEDVLCCSPAIHKGAVLRQRNSEG